MTTDSAAPLAGGIESSPRLPPHFECTVTSQGSRTSRILALCDAGATTYSRYTIRCVALVCVSVSLNCLSAWTRSTLAAEVTLPGFSRAGPFEEQVRWSRFEDGVRLCVVAPSAALTGRPRRLTVRTPKDEHMLIERFGQPYRDYMAQTGRFIPRLPRD